MVTLKSTKTVLFFSVCIFGGLGYQLPSLSNVIKQEWLLNFYNGFTWTDKLLQGDEVTHDKIKHYLWATNKSQNFTILNSSVTRSLIRNDVFYVILIHGWNRDRNVDWYGRLRNVLFHKHAKYYIIEVDWSEYAFKNVFIAANAITDVGNVVGDFLISLHQNYSIPLHNFKAIIGFSYGAHVAAIIGKKVQKVCKKKLPMIIGLDPGGPFFEDGPDNKKLTANDAEVVYVIHTNGDFFGVKKACGTIDFFPNGGNVQPGCSINTIFHSLDLESTVFCSHARSWRFLEEAIARPEKFLARKCNSWKNYTDAPNWCEDSYETMGNLETTKRGTYFLKTSNNRPDSQ